jgi:hypothetical protein
MMARWRLWLACVMLAAIPLQGIAAASMLFCRAATHDAAQSTQAAATVQHDHAGHSHAERSAATPTQGSESLPDAAHPCSLCASCCHSVAITEPLAIAALTAAPQTELADLFAPLPNRASPVPDKPPRA